MAERTSYEKNRNHNTKMHNEYIDGNTVRKEKAYQVPQRTERIYYNNERLEGVSRRTLRNRQKALHMNAGYVLILAVCSVIMCVVCAKYLTLKEDIKNKNAKLNKLEVKTEALKSQNDYIDYTINSYKDIEYISKVATEELGMVQAGKEQISFYDSSESEYMKQYKKIPTN